MLTDKQISTICRNEPFTAALFLALHPVGVERNDVHFTVETDVFGLDMRPYSGKAVAIRQSILRRFLIHRTRKIGEVTYFQVSVR